MKSFILKRYTFLFKNIKNILSDACLHLNKTMEEEWMGKEEYVEGTGKGRVKETLVEILKQINN